MGFGFDEAVKNAVEGWCLGTAPAILSILHCYPVLEAQRLDENAPEGIPGWVVFSGPYLLKGYMHAGFETLKEYCVNNPPIPRLSAKLKELLTPARSFNYLRLYRWNQFGDCFVNGKRNEEGRTALLNLDWADTPMSSYSQFMILLQRH